MAKLTEEQLKNWLKSDENMLCVKDNWNEQQLFKIPLNDDFTFIYYKRISTKETFGLEQDLKITGLYYKKDGCIYNPNYSLKSMCENMPIIKNKTEKSDFAKQLTEAIRDYIERIIDNDVSNLTISEISTEYKLKDVEDFIKYTAKDQVRALFLSDIEISDIRYQCKCKLSSLSDEEYICFITDKDALVAKKAEEYIRENQEDMLAQFYQNNVLRQELKKIRNNSNHELHKIKAIKNAVEESGAKSVRVTVNKKYKEFTFRYDAERLCIDPKGPYSNWGMNSSDERAFENMFGVTGDFNSNDISKITYGRNVIYDSSEFDVAETEDAVMAQTM